MGLRLVRPARFIEQLASIRKSLGASSFIQLEKNDGELLSEAAQLARRADYCKPSAASVTDQVLVPAMFDDFPIESTERRLITRPIDLIVDNQFLLLLQRSIMRHSLAAAEHPKVRVESCASSHKSTDVSSAFFAAFCESYDTHLPLLVHVHCHLPSMLVFRASERFWKFVCELLRVSRPMTKALSFLRERRIEAYVGDTEGGPSISATLVEWNDAIIQWEMSVRLKQQETLQSERAGGSAAKSLGKAPRVPTAATNNKQMFWQTFVEELEALRGQSR